MIDVFSSVDGVHDGWKSFIKTILPHRWWFTIIYHGKLVKSTEKITPRKGSNPNVYLVLIRPQAHTNTNTQLPLGGPGIVPFSPHGLHGMGFAAVS